MLTVGSCFSGIGGLELGLERTGGFKTQWQIENNEYASRVLAKHWPRTKRYSDIRNVVQPPEVDLICGGFPCQDVSVAGARAGLEGKRSTLWSEMFRLVCEVKPRWMLAENVPGLLTSDDGRFFGNILRDLAGAGYDAKWGVLSAAGVGAPHLRRRVFIVAHAKRAEVRSGSRKDGAREQESAERFGNSGIHVANSARRGQPIMRSAQRQAGQLNVGGEICDTAGAGLPNGTDVTTHAGSEELERSSWWSTEPNVGRVANGIPSRVDRLKCLGNAVVPQVAQKIGEMILAYAN